MNEKIKILPAFAYPQEVGRLFAEYTDMLIAGDSRFQDYLAIQHYEDELAQLSVKYGLPYGRLYLAFCNDEAVGCIGLRRLNVKNCEMKRLYVMPQYQRLGIGRRLVQRIIADAKAIGYVAMLLDTLPFLTEALRMYKKIGFYEIESYNNSPLDSSIYMRLDL
ncbi:MAG: GNAT family N-acetyltransferase [Peptococcaceae bacterium]|jgi:GNAT superfamily N-acetyltransferase|nr:GNAT family N-acetyltransferase [Peptococcaceae bacterium]